MLTLVKIDPHEGHGIAAHAVAVRSITGGTGEFDQVLADDGGTFSNDEGLFGGTQGGQGAGGYFGVLAANGAIHGKGAIPVQGDFTGPAGGMQGKPGEAQRNSSENEHGGGNNGHFKQGHSEGTSVVLTRRARHTEGHRFRLAWEAPIAYT
jgi:hypothetical protein